MKFENQIENFIKEFVLDLKTGSASIFAGAGLSIPAGFVNWKKLLQEIAEDLGLNIDSESDLVSLAQFHLNENSTRDKLNRKIINEFVEGVGGTENHKIISRLPLSSIWTTNYDKLIEESLKRVHKIVDVKYRIDQLVHVKPKRDIVLYKMHGDIDHANDAILTKEQYEQYHQTHEPFITTLSSELISKTFLFIGFSFTDPNLDYVLSRLNFRYSSGKRQHYSIIKRHQLGDHLNPDKASLDYNTRKQNLVINDLKRYGIKTLLIDDYAEVTAILTEIENRVKKESIFISGSAFTYAPFGNDDALSFIHLLSKRIIENNFRIINGFGLGVGSAVINGALEAIYGSPSKYSEEQLIVRPFPQIKTSDTEFRDLWHEYRERMISLAGISIFIFGNKVDERGNIIDADGIQKEFEIANRLNLIPIPIGATAYQSKLLYDLVKADPTRYLGELQDLVMPVLDKLADTKIDLSKVTDIIIELIKKINK